MQLTSAVVGSILVAGAFAAPRHHEGKRGSSLVSRARKFGATKATSANKAVSSGTSFSSLETDSNTQWAGAGYQGLYNSGETLKGVSTTFNVLDASIPTDADTGLSTYYASAWIGIDGQESCTDISNPGLWQAGVDSMIEDGTLSFYAWYEWYPADTVVIDLGDISAGDLISMNLTASSGTKGTIVMENTSTGKSFTKTVTSDNEMCLDTVEWIMEDVTSDDSSSGLAAFDTLTFADSVWVTDKGTYTAADVNQHFEITDRTSTSVSGEEVVIKYL